MNLQFKHSGFSGLVGVAGADITPPDGIYARNWGAAKHDSAKGKHRGLTVNALVICESEKGEPLVIVEADLGWWRSLELEREFRDSILREFDLDEPRFIFSLTHTHSAPPLTDRIDEDWEGGDFLLSYLEKVRQTTMGLSQNNLIII